MNRMLACTLLSAAALLITSALADGSATYNAKLTIRATPDQPSGGYLISGRFGSKKAGCVKGRVVGVHLKGIGERTPVAQAVVKANGKWALAKNYPLTPGKYWATVGRLRLKKGTCLGIRSRTITGKPFKVGAAR